jgi:hypothetical protein
MGKAQEIRTAAALRPESRAIVTECEIARRRVRQEHASDKARTGKESQNDP